MGKKKNKDKINFRVNSDFLKAYDTTLEKAVTSLYEKSDFRCQSFYPVENSLPCVDCPFQRVSDYCTDPSFEEGAGYKRTFEQWQDWFHKLTGVKDDRSKELIKLLMQTKEIAEQTKKETQIENQTNKDNIEKAAYQTPKEINGNYTLGNIANVAQTNFNLFTKELEEKAKSKYEYEVEYTALDSDEPRKEYVRKVVDLLSIIKEWNKEAIKWNLIANGNTSKIPFNFKDIYIKVYDPEEGVIIFQDECTLKSEGLKLAWIKDD
jgi:predicted HTH domain antitoxin